MGLWSNQSTTGTDKPNCAVNIEAGFERKLRARLAHVSQTASVCDLERNWRERATRFGEMVGVDLAETFLTLIVLNGGSVKMLLRLAEAGRLERWEAIASVAPRYWPF